MHPQLDSFLGVLFVHGAQKTQELGYYKREGDLIRNYKKGNVFFEATKKRCGNLETLCCVLLTLKSKSVEQEKAVSAIGIFVTKLKNSLSLGSLDALTFMRHY